MVVALARPQSSQSDSSRTTEGIDIVLSLDISGSMLARDFQPDRISAAKEVAASFIADRRTTRIGLVVFAGESFTQSPLTTDKASLLNILGTVRSGMIDDGTAIGNGLATAVNRLRESQAKSKVVILLSRRCQQQRPDRSADGGRHRFHARHPRLYDRSRQRGTGSLSGPRHVGKPQFRPDEGRDRREDTLRYSREDRGRYFRATDNEKLREIYKEINRLEKSRVEVESQTRYDERFAPFVLGALLLLAAGFAMRRLWFRQIP